MGMKGRCQCGAVRFEAPLEEPMKIYICHCLECRWQASSSYGLSAIFPAFLLPASSADNLSVWTRTTFRGREKNCYFCKHCGSRIYHHCPGQKLFTVKAGCLEGLSREMMDGGVHIWAKRAIIPIPEGAEVYDEEPPGEGGEPMEVGVDDGRESLEIGEEGRERLEPGEEGRESYGEDGGWRGENWRGERRVWDGEREAARLTGRSGVR